MLTRLELDKGKIDKASRYQLDDDLYYWYSFLIKNRIKANTIDFYWNPIRVEFQESIENAK